MFLASLPVTKHNRSLRSPRGWIGLQEQGTRGPPAAPLWGCPGDLQRPLERHADAEGSRVWVKDTDVASTTHSLPSPLWPALREPRGQTWTEGDNGSGHPTTLPPDSVAPACENSSGKGKWLLTGSGRAWWAGRGSPARLCLPARAPACPHPIGVKGLPAPGFRWYWYLPGWRAGRMRRV